MKKRNTGGPMTRHDKWLIVVSLVILAAFMLWPKVVFSEDFAIKDNQLNDSYNEVWLIYKISGVVQDTAYKYNVSRWDTTFSGIAAGQHVATFYLLDSADLSDTISYTKEYAYQAGLTLSGADIGAIADSIQAKGLLGGGTDTVTLYAVDSSATPLDTMVARVEFTIRNAGGSKIAGPISSGLDGIQMFQLDSGTFYVYGTAPGYHFEPYTLAVDGNDDSVGIPGYGEFLSNHAYLYGNLGEHNKDVLVQIEMPKSLNNMCDSVVAPRRKWLVQANSSGVWGVNVPYSSCFNDEPYKITILTGDPKKPESHTVVVPDSASFQAFWQ